MRRALLTSSLVLLIAFGTVQPANYTVEQIIVVEKEVPAPVPKLQQGTELQLEVTAYTYGDGSPDDMTRSGLPVDQGIIAVDPRVIPIGTVLWIENYGYGIAGDTGGAIQGMRGDIFLTSRHDANRWGRQVVTVKVIKLPEEELR